MVPAPDSRTKDVANTALNTLGTAVAVGTGSTVGVAMSSAALGYGLGSWAEKEFGIGSYLGNNMYDLLN